VALQDILLAGRRMGVNRPDKAGWTVMVEMIKRRMSLPHKVLKLELD
jgi:hypothetical protein